MRSSYGRRYQQRHLEEPREPRHPILEVSPGAVRRRGAASHRPGSAPPPLGTGQIGDDEIGKFQEDYVKGLLEVYALLPGNDPNDFSWIRSWESHQQTQQSNEDATTGMMAWAFNPPSGCH